MAWSRRPARVAGSQLASNAATRQCLKAGIGFTAPPG
jgi:hypothetical protein